ncbi:MAG TPA: hypothetical protein VGN91_11515 [Bosea sp. (in: a-proteobacteria)]|jgi:Ni/Co efflux regulator RcnB|nr:hypothetical protein [Bosea sp. (in: a-proteobacteria)]
MRHLLIAAAIALGAAVTPAAASETFSGAAALDKVEATYVRHTREHRMWEIQRNLERQQRYERRHRYRDDYGYGHRRGGPPPWAHGRRDHRRYDRF